MSAVQPLQLTRGQATRELLRLASPLIAVSASRLLMGFVDFVMVSKLGTDAQAAIGPATILVWTFLAMGMGPATSVQTFASQADGRGEPERGAAYVWQTIYMSILLVLVVWPVAACTPLMYTVIGHYGGQTPEVLQLQTDYTRITLWALTPAMMTAGLEGFFNGIQKPRITLIASLFSVAVNAFLNWVLIFGHLGAPAMGIYGAGLATVIGWWARTAVLLWAFLLPGLQARYHTRRGLAISLAKVWDIIRIGGPTAAQWFVEIASWDVFLNLIAPHYGTASLAATNIAWQYAHIAFMPAVGIGFAVCSQVGFAIGARRLAEAEFRTRVALRWIMVYMGLAALFLFFARWPLVRAFNSDPTVIDIGCWIMIWVSLYQIFDAMSITFIFALRGAGDTLMPAVLNGACCWILFVGGGALCAVFAPGFGIHGPWLLAVSYLSLLGLLLLWRFESGAWRRIKVFRDTGAAGANAAEEASAAPAQTDATEPVTAAQH